MGPNEIEVKMGEGVVARAPHVVSCVGLGSCVVAILYDVRRRIGGLAHIMLPESDSRNRHATPYRYADTAIATLLEGMKSRGAIPEDMVAKMVGGARMFSSCSHSSAGIGEQNAMSIKHILNTEGIPLVGEDTGGHHGREIEFHLVSGKLIVRAIGKRDREI
ncbi:chemotaxis protein CheD [Acidobacteriia bacterium AH_259_A11_L15]|nr:chemotaxis protein CheD [Acidobacteriia bacterium AH_259_A11_L15]